MTVRDLSLRSGDRVARIHVSSDKGGAVVAFDGGASRRIEIIHDDGSEIIVRDGDRTIRGHIVRDGRRTLVVVAGTTYEFEAVAGAQVASAAAGLSDVVAPMTGKVVDVHVVDGQEVAAGAPLLVLEAMKMEHRLTAPAAGTVAAVLVKRGQVVNIGETLIELVPTGVKT